MASGLMNLDEMIAFYGKEHFPIGRERLLPLLQDPDPNQWALGHLLAACNFYAAGHTMEAETYLRDVRVSTKTLSPPLIAMLIWLQRRTGNPQGAACDCAAYAQDASALGHDDVALEACSAALFLDQAGRFELTASPEKIQPVVEIYERAARKLAVLPKRTCSKGGRRRVALITGNLVDHAVAYSRRVLNLARFADRTCCEMRFYSTENLTRREQPLFPFGLENGGTAECAPVSLRTLEELDVPVWLAPRDQKPIETAERMIRKLEEDAVDYAIFQTGMASPIDWLVARCSPVPVKAGIHIGSSPFNTGFDLYFFDNPANIERENGYWTEAMGRRVYLTSGVDIDLLRKSPSVGRHEIGIPGDAVVIGTVSNHLGERMSAAFCQVIARVLQAHPDAWYLGVGMPPGEERMQLFRQAGVADRMRFPGPVRAASAVLGVLDVYANEFPVGGSESVKEAMACGIPVVAMRWSPAHAECAGAEIAGPVDAVSERDPDAYERLLSHWISDGAARREAAARQTARAEEHYSIGTYVSRLFEHMHAAE